jgi:hypothetical protein
MAICIEKGGITMMHNNFRLPISEELLGAYLEGSLSIEEAQMVEHIMRERGGFHDFVNELQSFDDVLLSNNLEDIPNFETDFELPDTFARWSSVDVENIPQHAASLYAEAVACSPILDIAMLDNDIKEDNDISISDNNEMSSVEIDVNTDDALFDNESINE